MLQIRPYTANDQKQIENICAPEGTPMQDAILTCFCRYYTEHEPENCFVCAEDTGKILGYVLCAADFSKWEETMQNEYIKKDSVCAAMGNATIQNLKPFAAEYPAHLHIDLAPGSQGQGLGSRLISALKEHLRAKGVQGLMLDVASDNTGAQRFYQKNGFKFLDKDTNSFRMGIKL